MNTTHWAPQRAAGLVYRKKRARPRPSSSSTEIVTGRDDATPPPRLEAAQTEVQLQKSQRSAPSLNYETSPSRRRSARCQTSSPAKLPRSPSSRRKMESAIGSPKKKALRRSVSHSILSLGGSGSEIDEGPKRSSFADRMKPRMRQESASSMPSDGPTASQQGPIGSQEIVVQKAEEGLRHETPLNDGLSQRTTATLPIAIDEMPPLAAVPQGQAKKYQRVRSQPSQPAVQLNNTESTEGAMTLIAKKPNLVEIRKRWAELDDLNDDDGEEEESATKSIIGLRNRGQSRQCQEDFQYLVMDLRPSQSLTVRRATCIEICTKILSTEVQESGEEDAAIIIADSQVQSIKGASSGTSAFLDYIRVNDLIRTVWRQMRAAGAGCGKDEVLDLSLMLICAKISLCAPTLLQSFCSSDADFTAVINAGLRESTALSSEVSKDSASLLRLAQTVIQQSPPSSRDGLLRTVTLTLLARCIDLRDDHELDFTIDTSVQIEGQNVFQRLWALFAIERASTMDAAERERSKPTDNALILISRIIVSCMDSLKIEDLTATSLNDVVSHLRHHGHIAFESAAENNESASKSLDVLSSLLRMVVAMMALDSQDWRHAFLQQKHFLPFVVFRMSDAVSLLVARERVVEDSSVCDYLEALTLLLALLTDILMVKTVEVRTMLLHSRSINYSQSREANSSPLLLMGQLLRRAKDTSDVDPEAGCLAGSLAVVLALLIIGQAPEAADKAAAPEGEKKEEEEGLSQDRMSVLQPLCRSLPCGDEIDCLQILISTIEDFAAVVKTASRRIKAMHGRADADVEAGSKEDAAFFSFLLEALRQLHSSANPEGTSELV